MGHKSRLIFSGHIFKGRIWFSGARTGLARDSWQSKVGSFSKELGPDIGGTVCSSQRSGSQFYCWHFELKTFDRQKRITVSTLFPNKPNELVNHVCPWDLLGAAWIGTEVGGAPEDTGWISSKNNHIRREACDIQLKLWCVCVISRAGECDSHSPPPPGKFKSRYFGSLKSAGFCFKEVRKHDFRGGIGIILSYGVRS